jgi:hypothetical protein
MAGFLVYYSVNTLLAYEINQRYYNGAHYVWCSPYFHTLRGSNPPSSNPRDLLRDFQRDIDRGDVHSSLIKQNRLGILSGCKAQRRNGVIDKYQEKEIKDIVNAATLIHFTPLLYVIPATKVRKIILPAPIAKRASVLSFEYIIENLPDTHFDLVEF